MADKDFDTVNEIKEIFSKDAIVIINGPPPTKTIVYDQYAYGERSSSGIRWIRSGEIPVVAKASWGKRLAWRIPFIRGLVR